VAGDGLSDAIKQGEYRLYRGSRCGPLISRTTSR
jgi:hypothetical protein